MRPRGLGARLRAVASGGGSGASEPRKNLARLAEAFQRVLVAGLQGERPLEGGPRGAPAYELELATADAVVEPVPLRPGPQGALEDAERLVVPLEVVEAPGYLRPHAGKLVGLPADHRLQSPHRGLERRQRGLVPAQLE